MELELPIIKTGQIYKHYKGCYYEVMGFATHSETNESMVLYRRADMSEPRIWARPQKMWLERVIVNNVEMFRFTLAKLDEQEMVYAHI